MPRGKDRRSLSASPKNRQAQALHRTIQPLTRCRNGPCTERAVTFKSAVDDPSRIAKSKAVGALFGLTPKKHQSGEKDVTGGITRAGDEMVRTALYEAANV